MSGEDLNLILGQDFYNSCRFINIVTYSGLSNSEMWSKVKTFRVKQLIKYSDNNFIYVYCFTNEELTSTIEEFARFVGVKNILDKIDRKISKSTLNNGAEMFQSLYSCPSFFVRLYMKAFYGNKTSTTLAMLASNIIKKANKEDFKEKAIKIFVKIASVLGFQYIFHFNNKTKSFERNILNVKGMKIKG